MNKRSPGTAVEWLLGTVKRNPEGLLLLGAGAVLLMRRGSGSRPSAAPTSRPVLSTVTEKATAARDAAGNLTGETWQGARQMAVTARDYASQATRQAGEQSVRVVQQGQAAVQETFARVLEQYPLAIALAGVATGAAIASLLPTTDFEKQNVGPIVDEVSDAAMKTVKDVAETAGETLKSAVEQRGLNAEGLKEVTSEVVGAATSRLGARGNGRDRENAADRSINQDE